METEKFFVAIDLGSTKITGVLAQKTPEGKIVILACESVDKIKDIDKTASQINWIVKKLNAHKILQENGLIINKIYAVLGGNLIKSVQNFVRRKFGNGMQISQKLLEKMRDENMELKIENADVFEVFEQEYLVDDKIEKNPEGMTCSNLAGKYVVVYGDAHLKFYLEGLQKVGEVEFANKQLAPYAMSQAALTPEDIESGCVFVDFGAETTSVCVYCRGYLRQLFVQPVGDDDVTANIMNRLNVSQEDAEELKINHGISMSEAEKIGRIMLTKTDGENVLVAKNLLSQVIEERIKCIWKNIWEKITEAGFSQYLETGFVIAGAGSKVKNLDKFIELQTNCTVSYADFSKYLELGVNNKFDNFNNAVLTGLLRSADENCVVLPPPPPPPSDNEQKGIKKLKNWFDKVTKTDASKEFIGKIKNADMGKLFDDESIDISSKKIKKSEII